MSGVVLAAAMVALACPASSLARPGDLDRSFGRSGRVFTPLQGGGYITGIARQPSEKLLAVGEPALVRYERDGSLDRGFGAGGILRPHPCFGLDVASQPDGSFVTAYGDRSGFRLSRCRPDGSLDPSFGAGGRADALFVEGGGEQIATDVTRQNLPLRAERGDHATVASEARVECAVGKVAGEPQ